MQTNADEIGATSSKVPGGFWLLEGLPVEALQSQSLNGLEGYIIKILSPSWAVRCLRTERVAHRTAPHGHS